MKKILLGLMVAASLSSASAQEITCKSALDNWDAYIPNLCDHTHGSLPGDYIYFDRIEAAPKPGVNWASAEKICTAHLHALFGDNLKPEAVAELYDEGFKKPCEIVLQHEEEENRHEEAEKVLEDKVKSLSDLNDLSKALGVFK